MHGGNNPNINKAQPQMRRVSPGPNFAHQQISITPTRIMQASPNQRITRPQTVHSIGKVGDMPEPMNITFQTPKQPTQNAHDVQVTPKMYIDKIQFYRREIAHYTESILINIFV